ncbi:kinase-like domain-containing protein, partial [Ochromonadaceae sp. CCMP2298]
ESEVIKTHFEQLRRDEGSLAEERRMLESEKAVHQKELKRCQCEERSRYVFYRDLPQLNDRYLLTSMLGRGGFSEVWKALDLLELKEVAVKIHQLNPSWSEERKQSYIKHVTREYTIHRDMRHPRVVQLFDVFEIDVNCFATVLEYCRGIDLDEKLKRQKTIPEKDAKAILMQVRSMNGGMGMGSKKRLSIIHFDLKPANILFDESGDVKITDFGLSKIIDESNEGTSMELTSQGAGTYWYLPPECFAKGSEAPRISSKVDVWSAGIIFFQMLYGYRPYGEGKTQENVWSEGLIYRASQVRIVYCVLRPVLCTELL